MGRAIIKLAEDEYVEWSTVVDAPVTYITTRASAVAAWGGDRVGRADTNGHSWQDTGPMTPQEAIRGNRAGPDELTLTLDGIRRRYRNAEASRAPLDPADVAPCVDGCGVVHHPWIPCEEAPMPADVNVTEKVARALKPSAWDGRTYLASAVPAMQDIARAEADRVLAALADPEVLAGIAGVLWEHQAVMASGWLRGCACGWGPVASPDEAMSDRRQHAAHQAAALVEHIRGRS